MRKWFNISVFFILMGAYLPVNAQEYIKSKIIDKNGGISLVTFKKGVNLNKSTSKKNLFKEVLNLSANSEFRLSKSEEDLSGNFLDEKYQLYLDNVKVEFGVYNLHYKNGNLISMNGRTFNTSKTDTSPKITSTVALEKAIQSVGAKKYIWEDSNNNIGNYKKPVGELVLIPIEQNDYILKLAYKFDIYALEPVSRSYIYVDALNGNILLTNNIIKHAKRDLSSKELNKNNVVTKSKKAILKNTSSNLDLGNADTRYSGLQTIETSLDEAGNYILFDKTRGDGIRTYNLKKSLFLNDAVDFTDNDNNWTAEEFDNENYDNAALDAHLALMKTYDYFKDYHNRNSYDNNGAILRSYVHYGQFVNNIYWDGESILHGDGDGTNFDVFASVDFTAHEVGHGITGSTASLIYNRESGALNEAFSDIWGAAVKHTYFPEKEIFVTGDEITLKEPFYVRSMVDPKSANHPDTYRGENWYPATIEEGCPVPNDGNDNCGVHTNSSVLNHWFYILVNGKTGTNDIGKSYSVEGIGFEKASKITYRLLANYLTPTSGYENAKDFGIQSAKDLYGEDSTEDISTQGAFYAVGLGKKYNPSGIEDTTSPTIPTNLSANSTTDVSTKLVWTASTDNFALDGYDVYKDNQLIGSTYNNYFDVAELLANTTYNFKVQAKDEAGNKSDFSNVATVTTLPYTYCQPDIVGASFAAIVNVKLNTIDNQSTEKEKYENFSYLSTNVLKGETYTITVTPWVSPNFGPTPTRYILYADYNNNGLFTDDNEIAWTQPIISTGIVSGSFTIPANAALGIVRIRLITAEELPTTPCSQFEYGQVEDYSLNIIENLAIGDLNKGNETIIYPNPVDDIIIINSKNYNKLFYQIYNMSGQVVLKGNSNNKMINVKNLPSGNYILKLSNKQGVKSTQKFIKK